MWRYAFSECQRTQLEHIAIPGGLLPNAFSLSFALCKREKIIVFSFLWKILWVMLVCVGQPRFRPLPRVMFMWRKAILPVQVANMGINWICCKFLFGKYFYFMGMSNCIDAKRLVYRISCVVPIECIVWLYDVLWLLINITQSMSERLISLCGLPIEPILMCLSDIW